MIRVTKLADYGVLLMTWFARHERMARRVRATEPLPPASATGLAEATGLPGPTVSKLLRQLCKADLLTSTRGVRGGYRLARPSEAISMAEVLEAVEGPIALTECLEDGPTCGMQARCPTQANWGRINQALRGVLDRIPLSDMARDPLTPPPPAGTPLATPQAAPIAGPEASA